MRLFGIITMQEGSDCDRTAFELGTVPAILGRGKVDKNTTSAAAFYEMGNYFPIGPPLHHARPFEENLLSDHITNVDHDSIP